MAGTTASIVGLMPPVHSAASGTTTANVSTNWTNCVATADSGSTRRGNATLRTSGAPSTIEEVAASSPPAKNVHGSSPLSR